MLNHIISPRERQFVCRVDYENPELMLPINKSVPRIVTLTAKDVKGMPIYKEMRDGDDDKLRVDVMDIAEFCSGKYLFLVQYLDWKQEYSSPLGIIIGKLPQKDTVDASMEILFAEHGIRKSFDEESKQQVLSKFPTTWSVPAEEYQSRKKIEGAFTIDPEMSKDLDDALTVEQLPESVYRIGVHIADVSYFVKEGTPLDKDALFRCTSYYPGFGYGSVPMLPPALSENHCSLLPGKDRLSLSVFLDLSEEGKLLGLPEIKRTIVRSCCRLSYGEAQKVIDGHHTSTEQIPNDTARKIQALSLLAQKRRVMRLKDAAFDHWSDIGNDPESFKAHEMVEEMMILANEQVANYLSTDIPDAAPLRTQLPPKEHRLNDWVRQYGQFVNFSLYLRGFYSEETLQKITADAECSKSREFKVQQSVWSDICDAAMLEDHTKLQFLICNERHHPQLAVANSHFQRIQPKSQYVCKGDLSEENVVHFSMGIPFYTHFTSPIRRYVDIQVHRLVLDLITTGGKTKEVSKDQVAKVCRRSTFAQANSRRFEKGCNKVHTAAKLREQSQETKAVIALIEDRAISLEILNQEFNHLSATQRKLKLSSLNPLEFRIAINEDVSEIVLTWKQRLYIAPRKGHVKKRKAEKEEVKKLLSQGMVDKEEVLDLSAENWRQILEAMKDADYSRLRKLIAKTDRDRQIPRRNNSSATNTGSSRPDKKDNMGHFYEKRLTLKTFDVVNIQLSAHMTHGFLHPEVQLFKINPSVHICIEHRENPTKCFATLLRSQASRVRYSSVDNYFHAWKPVLAMEAATGAVDENDEFTIHNLDVQWTKTDSKGDVKGSFSLLEEYCTIRQIEFHVGDFVCVRVQEDQHMKANHSASFAAGHGTERGILRVSKGCLLA